MPKILPFQRTGALIQQTDDFLDRVSEAALVFERTFLHYLERGPDESLDERVTQIRDIEKDADELRRSVLNTMYSEMLMPDTRGDVLSLLDEVDGILDETTHRMVRLALERPEFPPDLVDDLKELAGQVTKAVQAMLRGARAYFTQPHAVRDHVHEISFHESEATTIVLQRGRRIFDSDLPLERKRQLSDWIVAMRSVASRADDIGDGLAIFAVKRSS